MGKTTGKTEYDVSVPITNVADRTLVAKEHVVKISQPHHGVVHPWVATRALFNNATRTYQLNANGGYEVDINGTRYLVTTNLSVQIGTQLGQHFIWFYVNNGVIALATAFAAWNILDTTVTPLDTVHWDGVEGIIAKEDHDYRRNLLEHKNQHDSWGAQYVSGFSPVPTFTNANTFTFPGGVIRDEENYLDIAGTQSVCRVGYRVAGTASMTWNASGAGYAKLNATIPQYDNAGVLTDIPLNQYGIYWVFATNRELAADYITSIVGQGVYASVAACQAAPMPSLPGLSVAEWKLLYRVIVRRTGGTPLQMVQTDVEYNKSTGPVINGGTPTIIPQKMFLRYVSAASQVGSPILFANHVVDTQNTAALPSTTPYTSWGNGGCAPTLTPACIIKKVSFAACSACVGQSTVGANPTAQFEIFSHAHSSRTSLGTFDIPVAPAEVNINSNLGGLTNPKGSLNAAITIADLSAIGIQFNNRNADNNQIVGLARTTIVIECELI